MGHKQYSVIVTSKEGRQLIGDCWEDRLYNCTWSIYDTYQEALTDALKLKGFVVATRYSHLYIGFNIGKPLSIPMEFIQ